ncbi:GNAT family N-acetyltransferase [Psychrobium sp. 1_MG-2023]|uniref:GNAT family N-acetyltransferase n=1 Tax=Psychrobium sp. 1_MG-2023 TaxID=3062624 RepID=UPI0027342916|nr:GNAT family N-acetyltransferase [Psychrobium sp. 1_MG-2023]MDP2560480.1 GNAT family N-acetyltransferase [Psychrobium sp. 1_MG-2023]
MDYSPLARLKTPLANKFYASEKARAKARNNELIWVAKFQHTIVACAKLSPVDNHWLLTGVHVCSAYRQQGIAQRLITLLCQEQPIIYTFALSHLASFYQHLGFQHIKPQQLPCELAQRFNAYLKQGRKIIVMIKE